MDKLSSFKREAFRGTEFAPRILADNNISVVMKVFTTYHDSTPFGDPKPAHNSQIILCSTPDT
jgi:hypothetical protein